MKKAKKLAPPAPRTLGDDVLPRITGGDAPRDPATGIPVGKRP